MWISMPREKGKGNLANQSDPPEDQRDVISNPETNELAAWQVQGGYHSTVVGCHIVSWPSAAANAFPGFESHAFTFPLGALPAQVLADPLPLVTCFTHRTISGFNMQRKRHNAYVDIIPWLAKRQILRKMVLCLWQCCSTDAL